MPSLIYYQLMHGAKTAITQLRTTPMLKQKANERAQSMGLSLTGYIEYLIIKEVEEHEGE